MIDVRRLIIAGTEWISILYVVCFGAVAIYPELRTLFMKYALHVDIDFGTAVTTPLTFIIGFVFWNIVIALAFGLFGVLFNRIKG